MTNATLQLTIIACHDGGLAIYETVQSDEYGALDQRLVFGGNLDEASRYLTDRMGKILAEPAKQIEPPKARKKRVIEPSVINIDDLELIEEDAD